MHRTGCPFALLYESPFSIQSLLGPGVQPPEEVLPNLPGFGLSTVLAHTRFTGTAGRFHFVVYLTHFPRYGPSCCSLKCMHFQTSVIRLVDRFTWSYRFVIILQITLIQKICELWKLIWINIDKSWVSKYRLKSRNLRNLAFSYLGYHGNFIRFICF